LYGGEANDRLLLALQILDLRTQRVATLPGSEGLWSPRWSPDGRYILAHGFPDKLWLYDVAKRTATKLTDLSAGWPSWSRNSQYVYFKDKSASEWCRVNIHNRVVSRTGISFTGVSLGWVGVDMDGFPITTRIRGGREIYALDWDVP
jgi:dipeptidyl aminopeptidase/acylaminoacyl peptidase